MKILKLVFALAGLFYMTSCASGYQSIKPENLNYNSKKKSEEGISLAYKYDLLPKKYAKKEKKNDVRLIALGITNNTNRQLVFGKDFQIAYEDGTNIMMLSKEKTFGDLKQKGAYHLLYLLLTPTNLTTTTTSNGYTQSQSFFPIGLILGPGLAGYNLIKASSANKRFKNDLENYNLIGKTINPGEEKFGIIGIRSNSYDALKIHFIGNPETEENTTVSEAR